MATQKAKEIPSTKANFKILTAKMKGKNRERSLIRRPLFHTVVRNSLGNLKSIFLKNRNI